MSLLIQHRKVGTTEVLDCNGQLTLGDGTAALRQAIKKSSGNLLLNLSGVTYIDSAGLGELVGSYSTVKEQGRKMKLLNPAKRVDSLLQVTKLYTTFECFTEEQKALESM